MGMFHGQPAPRRYSAEECAAIAERVAAAPERYGRWVTTEDDQHVYIDGGKVLPHGPGTKPAGGEKPEPKPASKHKIERVEGEATWYKPAVTYKVGDKEFNSRKEAEKHAGELEADDTAKAAADKEKAAADASRAEMDKKVSEGTAAIRALGEDVADRLRAAGHKELAKKVKKDGILRTSFDSDEAMQIARDALGRHPKVKELGISLRDPEPSTPASPAHSQPAAAAEKGGKGAGGDGARISSFAFKLLPQRVQNDAERLYRRWEKIADKPGMRDKAQDARNSFFDYLNREIGPTATNRFAEHIGKSESSKATNESEANDKHDSSAGEKEQARGVDEAALATFKNRAETFAKSDLEYEIRQMEKWPNRSPHAEAELKVLKGIVGGPEQHAMPGTPRRYSLAECEAIALVARYQWDASKHPRDGKTGVFVEKGGGSSGGGGSESGGSATPFSPAENLQRQRQKAYDREAALEYIALMDGHYPAGSKEAARVAELKQKHDIDDASKITQDKTGKFVAPLKTPAQNMPAPQPSAVPRTKVPAQPTQPAAPSGIDPEAARMLRENGKGGPGAKLDGKTQVDGPEAKLFDPPAAPPAPKTQVAPEPTASAPAPATPPASTGAPKEGLDRRRGKLQAKAAKNEAMFAAMSDDERKAHKAEKDAKAAYKTAKKEKQSPGLLQQLLAAWSAAKAPANTARQSAAQRVKAAGKAAAQAAPPIPTPAQKPAPAQEPPAANPFDGWHAQTQADRWMRHRQGGYYAAEGTPARYSMFHGRGN